MTYGEALKEAQSLAEAIRDRGVKVSIELRTGADGNWLYPARKVAVMSHHTATRRSWGLTPALAICKKGRGGALPVPGPLCNTYGGFDLIARILTMGIANHSGKGGPLEVPGAKIPKDLGRYVIDGCEFEGGLDLDDFTDEYREFMARVNAGRLDYYRLPLEAHVEHLTWAPGRKIDRLGYTTESGRREIVMLGGGKTPVQPVRPVVTYEDASKNYDNGSRTLTIGKAGSDVGFVQSYILSNVLVDRKYGPLTATAVKTWQARNGLVKDGIFGPVSWGVALNLGDKDAVKALQGAVHGLLADGYWGPTTDRVVGVVRTAAKTGAFPWGVVAVQKAIGVRPDNWWGNVSRRALVKTVIKIQQVLKVREDGQWGPVTDNAFQRLRSRNYLRR